MFFFVGGVQPRKVTVDDTPRMCPRCGLALARLKRIDHYISLFFIPLIPVKRGAPFVECQRCHGIFTEAGKEFQDTYDMEEGPGRRCPSCGKQVESDYAFCPFCGRKM